MESETLREVKSDLDNGVKYTLVSTIKEGRVFKVVKAGKFFILKTSDGSAKGIEQLKREYDISIGLSHPGLAYVFTYETVSLLGPYIIQEYVDGESLSEWLRHNPPKKERQRIVSELLSVTAYLHKKGVIHNDLKPENILITRSGGSLKLIDLGFADNDSYIQKGLGGTRSYASPELLAGGHTDARSDVYSIGKVIRDIFRFRYIWIINRCLSAEPKLRYDSAGSLEAAWKKRNKALRVFMYTLFAAALGFLLYAYIATQSELSGMRTAEQASIEALSGAKAEVDAWYATNVPALLEEMSRARSREEINAAWGNFVNKTAFINVDIPARLPEEIRPAFRDYALQCYNTTFPSLNEKMNNRMREVAQ